MAQVQLEVRPRVTSQYVFPSDQPVVWLDCETAFEALTDREKLYAHHLSMAAWYGGLVTLVQTSPESPLIFALLQKLYGAQPLPELCQIAIEKCSITSEEFMGLLVYSSGIYTNMGNYKGFGDTKFVPDIPKDKFEKLLLNSVAHQKCPTEMDHLWKLTSDAIYSLDMRKRQLGLVDDGVTTYFSSNCTKEDAELANRFCKAKDIEVYNTRLLKTSANGQERYEVRLASATTSTSTDEDEEKLPLGTCDFEGAKFDVTRGDYSGFMELVIEYLQKAKVYAANDTEVKMLNEYIRSFKTGSLPAHKQGSRFWIKDKGPVIETYIGFIETYRDPVGQRGEFEGFVAMVNKEMSAKFAKLVLNSEKFLTLLPWPRTFEKDEFLRPDFTSLDVLTFAGSGIPAGINIPNYDEIRQSEGFKNVSLGNVIPASYKDNVIPFLSPADQEIVKKFRVQAFELQVGLHELLGHGSGKLFCRSKDGTFNFDRQSTMDPFTSEPVKDFYEPGETYDSKFTSMGSAYEECRAECVGLILSLECSVLDIFAYEGDVANDVTYVNWLSMVWAGLRALEMYQPEHSKWGQAHAQARFVILQVLIEAGHDLIRLEKTTGSDGEPDLLLTIDPSKISTVGKEAIAHFLTKLQVYKSTGNIVAAKEMFDKYSAVNSFEPGRTGLLPFLSHRDVVVARRQPRKMFVQPNTVLDSDTSKVYLTSYEASHAGLIKSWVDRFSDSSRLHAIIMELFERDRQYFDI